MIGQTLAIEHRHRLCSLLLSGTSAVAVPGGMAMWERRFRAITEAGSVAPIADETMKRWFTDDFQIRRPLTWQQVRDTVAATSPAGYLAGAAAIIDFDVLAELGAVTTPTLVLCGDDDPGTPPAGNMQIARQVPGARYQQIADARHIPMIERSEAFNRIMLDWLSAHRLR
jgi:3-oxoadipate enol-lactonase